MSHEIVQVGEELVIPCDDPAVTVVRGFRRFLVAIDIAQSAGTVDANAIAIIEDSQVPRPDQTLGPRRRVIVRSERLPAMSYVQLAQVTKNLMLDPMLAGRSYLVADAGGPGRSYCDLLDAKSVQHTRCQIVSGENESETTERGVRFNNVSRNLLLGSLNSALHTGDLLIGDFPMRSELQAELEAVEATIGVSGRMRLTGGTASGHLDMALASAMAFWLSDHRSVGAHIGQVPLRGYW
ncbi:hypothetical protein LX70_00553 [Defluviimonas denitrificans]|jgi:hypothetical protein|uniref:Uncharacterized protein n=1 Tax=Albidovulum denitrificans TaxID=404881 RepID=A0A2S8SD69_9RHOB|nr:hypothetical protein [Defluviimonas denitrificans]PQV58740.1 hypothetical protein LX70_00553 [Defluviimonas denitrificans]